MKRRVLNEGENWRWDDTEILSIWGHADDDDPWWNVAEDVSDVDSDAVVDAYLRGHPIPCRDKHSDITVTSSTTSPAHDKLAQGNLQQPTVVHRLVSYPTFRFSSEALPIYYPQASLYGIYPLSITPLQPMAMIGHDIRPPPPSIPPPRIPSPPPPDGREEGELLETDMSMSESEGD
jgi:hypothetical protein